MDKPVDGAEALVPTEVDRDAAGFLMRMLGEPEEHVSRFFDGELDHTDVVQAFAQARLAGVKEGLEMAAAYVDGQGGLIPGANVFAALVTGNNQPCMSGDARDRMQAHKRRQFDDATFALSSAIRSLGPRP